MKNWITNRSSSVGLPQRSPSHTAIAVVVALVTSVSLSPSASAQNSGLSDHDRTIKAESDRYTAYHNNADDYPASDPAGNAALADKIAKGFKSSPAITTAEELARRRDQEWNAEYERKAAILNQLSASAANGNEDAGLSAAGMIAHGEGIPPDPERGFGLYTLIGERQPDGFYQAGLLLLEGGSVATIWKLARDEPRAMGLIRKAADRGSIPAKKWLAANASGTVNTATALPGIDQLFDATMRAYAVSATPTNPKNNQKLLDENTKLENFHGPSSKEYKIKSALQPRMIAAGIATLFGVGLPADPAMAEKLFNFTPQWWDETINPAFLAYIKWTAAPGAQATYQGLDKFLADEGITRNRQYMVEYVRALVAAGTNNLLRERQILAAGANTSRYECIQMMVALAVMQLEGRGGPKDEAGGLANLNAAAATGNYNAQYVFGLVYEKGLHGVQQDTNRAAQLFTSAAVGQPAAQSHLSGNLGGVVQTTKP